MSTVETNVPPLDLPLTFPQSAKFWLHHVNPKACAEAEDNLLRLAIPSLERHETLNIVVQPSFDLHSESDEEEDDFVLGPKPRLEARPPTRRRDGGVHARLEYVSLSNTSWYINTLSILPSASSGSGSKALEANFDRPAIVLLHGFGAGLGLWFTILDQLSRLVRDKNVPCYAFDWIGMGRSSRVSLHQVTHSDWSTTWATPPDGTPKSDHKSAKERVEQTESFFISSLDEWRRSIPALYNPKTGRGRKLILVGHSLGGYLATAYTFKYAKWVKKLILLSPAGVHAGTGAFSEDSLAIPSNIPPSPQEGSRSVRKSASKPSMASSPSSFPNQRLARPRSSMSAVQPARPTSPSPSLNSNSSRKSNFTRHPLLANVRRGPPPKSGKSILNPHVRSVLSPVIPSNAFAATSASLPIIRKALGRSQTKPLVQPSTVAEDDAVASVISFSDDSDMSAISTDDAEYPPLPHDPNRPKAKRKKLVKKWKPGRDFKRREAQLAEEQAMGWPKWDLEKFVYDALWTETFNPFGLLRTSAMFAPMIVAKYVNSHFPQLPLDSQTLLHAYLTNLALLPSSHSEFSYLYLLNPGGSGRSPLLHRISLLIPFDIPVTFIYAERDWMDPMAGTKCVELLNKGREDMGRRGRCKTALIRDSGHQVHLDNPQGVWKVLSKEIDEVLQSHAPAR